jgi:hypothetical protein
VSSPSDFPSGARLRDAGIEVVVIVQSGIATPRLDLVATLAAWQDAGLDLRWLDADVPAQPEPIRVRRPGWFRRVASWWGRRGLRGDADVGFGARVPDLQQGG